MAFKKIAGIYAITCIINNKKYIGYSTTIKNRWNTHKNKLNKNIHENTHLQAAWNIYGENMFVHSILEILPQGLTKKEYEIVETKWVLYFNTHKNVYGYNACLPGNIPLRKQDENITTSTTPFKSYVCINTQTKIVNILFGTEEVIKLTNLKMNKIMDLCNYWKGTSTKKSLHSWMIVRKEDYKPDFDYIGFRKVREKLFTKTWRDYELTRKTKYQKVENPIPREQRNLKRIPIIATNILTKEETLYSMIKDCYKDFLPSKVYKCINNEYGKYSHRGFYFKKYLDN